jgi:hypothetical protein
MVARARVMMESLHVELSHIALVSPLPLVPADQLNGPPAPERRQRFVEVVRRALVERRYSPRTEEAYLFWIKRALTFAARRSVEVNSLQEPLRAMPGLRSHDSGKHHRMLELTTAEMSEFGGGTIAPSGFARGMSLAGGRYAL